MTAELMTFLSQHRIAATESATWAEGQIELSASLIITSDSPPDDLVTSARCIVTTMDQILVMVNPGGRHILPGGRREQDESIEDALNRELREETGIVYDRAERVAVLHFHHETPIPLNYPYPYPDFLNQIFIIRLNHEQAVTVYDDYELSGKFVPIDIVEQDGLPPIQRCLVEQLRDRSPDETH